MKTLQILVCCCAMSVGAFADQAHLAGTWKGTAQKTVCGKPVALETIVLVLEDKGFPPVDGKGEAFGDLSGYLKVAAIRDGEVALKFDAKTAKANSFLGSNKRDDGTWLSKNSSLSTYWIDLQASEPWGGFGYFQTLSGTFAKANFGCMNLGDQGEVLTVTLKKQ